MGWNHLWPHCTYYINNGKLKRPKQRNHNLEEKFKFKLNCIFSYKLSFIIPYLEVVYSVMVSGKYWHNRRPHVARCVNWLVDVLENTKQTERNTLIYSMVLLWFSVVFYVRKIWNIPPIISKKQKILLTTLLEKLCKWQFSEYFELTMLLEETTLCAF